MEKTEAFLIASQDSAGSWNNNAYETALAILALQQGYSYEGIGYSEGVNKSRRSLPSEPLTRKKDLLSLVNIFEGVVI